MTLTLDPETNLRECSCPQPERKPQKPDVCVRCGFYLNPRWMSNDATIQSFYDGVANGFSGGAPEWFDTFRLHCEQREYAGRKTFRESYLARDNVREGTEEAADGANYAFFKSLQEKRAGGDPQMDLALTAAQHFALAYKALAQMNDKDRGKP